MTEIEKQKKCPEYCPFLKANNTFCELFAKNLSLIGGMAIKCEECLNPEQRMASYKSLGLSMDNRIEMWQKAVWKHNEIELGKKREEEAVRQEFAGFLSEKYGDRPPLAGNMYLNNLMINIYMVLDATERQMMKSILNSRGGDELLKAVDRTPKDDSLLRNVRRELDSQYRNYQKMLQNVSGGINKIRE